MSIGKPAPKIHQWIRTIYFCRWGFGWVDKAQCFRSARRFGAAGSKQRDGRKWRHHCRAKVGDEVTLSHSKNSLNWRIVYTFPFQKFALFVSPFTFSVSPFLNGHHCCAEIGNEFTLSVAKKGRPLCSHSLKLREPRDEWSETQDKWSNPAQPYYRKRGIIGSAEALPVLCVMCARWERERERERNIQRERPKWRHLSSAEIGVVFCTFLAKNCTLVLAKNCALFPAKNLHLSFSRLERRWVHPIPCQKLGGSGLFSLSTTPYKNVALPETVPILRQMAWHGIEAPKQTIKFPAAPSFFSSKKWIKLITKTT